MADLCFVTTCMGRLSALRHTVGPMLDQPARAGVVVVDYSCPDGSGAWVEANHPTDRVVRVPQNAREANRRIAGRRRLMPPISA
jgi:hypothetical protein